MEDNLKQELTELGLETVENVSKELIETVFKLIEIVISHTENKFDDMLLMFLPKLKESVLNLVDKIK